MKMSYFHMPQQSAIGDLGGSAPEGQLSSATKIDLGAAFSKSKHESGHGHQPQCVFPLESNSYIFLSRLLLFLGRRGIWAAGCSVGTGGLGLAFLA